MHSSLARCAESAAGENRTGRHAAHPVIIGSDADMVSAGDFHGVVDVDFLDKDALKRVNVRVDSDCLLVDALGSGKLILRRADH